MQATGAGRLKWLVTLNDKLPIFCFWEHRAAGECPGDGIGIWGLGEGGGNNRTKTGLITTLGFQDIYVYPFLCVCVCVLSIIIQLCIQLNTVIENIDNCGGRPVLSKKGGQAKSGSLYNLYYEKFSIYIPPSVSL